MTFDRRDYPNDLLLHLYRELLKPRLIEEKMLILLRQGKVSKWFSGIGQEAISVGSTLALEPDEYILPLHRNLGVFTGRGVPLGRLFAQWQGKRHRLHQGPRPQLPLRHQRAPHRGHDFAPRPAAGRGRWHRPSRCARRKSRKVTLTYSGDGGASEGDFHEALNVAAVWQLPVIFMIENNGYGLSTPSNEQFRFKSFVDKGPAYGMEAVQVDGNNVLEVYHDRQSAWPKTCARTRARCWWRPSRSGCAATRKPVAPSTCPPSLMEEWASQRPGGKLRKVAPRRRHPHRNQPSVQHPRKNQAEAIEAGLRRKADAEPMPTWPMWRSRNKRICISAFTPDAEE